VGDLNATLAGRHDVDAVVAHAEHGDDLQGRQLLQQLPGDRGFTVGDQRANIGRRCVHAGTILVRLDHLIGGVQGFIQHGRQFGDLKDSWLHRNLAKG
jgi:hypothetical protein